MISSGHGKYVSGAVGILNEVMEARKVVAELGALLPSAGVACVTFNDDTSKTQAENLKTIVAFHNSKTRNLDVSVHLNASNPTDKPMGVEVLYYTEKDLSAKLSAAIAKAIGLPDRGAKERKDLYFLKNTAKPAVLIEVCFVDSTADVAAYRANFSAACKAIVGVLVGEASAAAPSTPQATTPPPAPTVAEKATVAKTPIVGKPELTAEQLAAFLTSRNAAPKINCSPLELARFYIQEGNTEGVRGDVAFCQALWETGNFNYGGIVNKEANNYYGCAAFNDNAPGVCATFGTPQVGVNAHILHLVAYVGLNIPEASKIDPRFNNARALAPCPNWEDLGGKWAVPGFDKAKYKGFAAAYAAGDTYGQNIVKLWQSAKAFAAKYAPVAPAPIPPAPTKMPEEVTVDNAIADGIITDRVHWLGVLTGNIKPVPEYLKKVFDNAHVKIKGGPK